MKCAKVTERESQLNLDMAICNLEMRRTRSRERHAYRIESMQKRYIKGVRIYLKKHHICILFSIVS